MGAPVVELTGVGKRYRLGENHGMDLREQLATFAGRVRRRERAEPQFIWSLRDVSLTVVQGEALGVIGANGAGKSTLLKVISNITTPTEGRSRTRGRVGSLLEVGTGFHGDLTGLENTYLNGAILGMTRREVASRLDEIVAFAGLERFMDTPVKRYSSGMYLRLGFSIAAHLEADILLVDEVLAVGDAEFQRRCLGKMSEVEQGGRTVIFVSHDMEAMARLCPTSIWLEGGRVRTTGPTPAVIAEYLRSSASGSAVSFADDGERAVQLRSIRIVDEGGDNRAITDTWSVAWIELDVIVRDVVAEVDVCLFVANSRGASVLGEALMDTSEGLRSQGCHRLRCRLDPVLMPGRYAVSVWIGTAYEDFEWREHVFEFTVEGSDGARPDRLVRLNLPWTVEEVE